MEALYFDGDLVNKGTSTAFVSKNWIFNSGAKFEINLSGEDAVELLQLKADDGHGQKEDFSGQEGKNG